MGKSVVPERNSLVEGEQASSWIFDPELHSARAFGRAHGKGSWPRADRRTQPNGRGRPTLGRQEGVSLPRLHPPGGSGVLEGRDENDIP